jgi:hypothetical protein
VGEKKLTQLLLWIINFYIFRIINRITAILALKEHVYFFILLKQVSKIGTALTRGQERSREHWKTNAYSQRNENQGICGTSEYLKCQRHLWDWVLDRVNGKENLLFHVAEECQKETANIFFPSTKSVHM